MENLAILNGGFGAHNIVDLTGPTADKPAAPAHTTYIKCIREIQNCLQQHCGPDSGFSLLHDLGTLNSSEFTKDGLKIMSAMKYMNPLEDHTRSVVRYIGERVESVAGDRTTSSMLLSVGLLLHFLTEPMENRPNYNTFKNILDDFTKHTVVSVEQAKVTLENSTENIYDMAFKQAMSSTHGDSVMSNAVAKVFSSISKEGWNTVSYSRRSTETDTVVNLEKIEADYFMPVTMYDSRMLGDNTGDAIIVDDVDILAVCAEAVDKSLEASNLIQMIRKRTTNLSKKNLSKPFKPLLVIIPPGMDATTGGTIRTLLSEFIDSKRIYLFISGGNWYENRIINDMRGLCAAANVNIENQPSTSISGKTLNMTSCSFKYSDGNLSITFNHPKKSVLDIKEAYRTTLKDVHAKLTGTPQDNSSTLLSTLARIRRALSDSKYYNICIGGSSYDHIAAISVLEDAMKATRATLTCGYTHGCFITLYNCIENDAHSLQSTHNVEYTRCYEYIKKAYLSVIEGIIHTVMPSNSAAFLDEMHVSPDVVPVDVNGLSIIQPASVDITVLKRINEVVIKLLYVNKVITTGGVNTSEHKQ